MDRERFLHRLEERFNGAENNPMRIAVSLSVHEH
jgi:hypothetical protein